MKYEVDVRPLLDLTETNYFMPIFECLQPVGKILPGKTLHLEFIFSPLEAVKYSVSYIGGYTLSYSVTRVTPNILICLTEFISTFRLMFLFTSQLALLQSLHLLVKDMIIISLNILMSTNR